MAAVQHSRTRSDRMGGGTAPAVTPVASRRPLSMHGRLPPATPTPTTPSAVRASAAAAPSPSSIPAFLTNLRLLDLDLRDDWPGITPATFAGTTQNHKRRVQAVEWALYRLFEIWDPEETASKLKPYFPPVEQLQSVSLRAALLRGLENAKKSGALGRDALIRKTMLDDCKGERLEEVLAAFSTTVLRSTLAGRSRSRPRAVALALDDSQTDSHLLRPLVLAHRASLRRSLDRRREAAAKYSDFNELVAMKERGLARRDEVLRARPAPAVSEDACRRVRQTVRDNWSGNEAWMGVLLTGGGEALAGAREEAKGLLAAPYDRVWRRVQQGRLAELEDDGRGLLQQLDARVEAQRLRLARWDELRRDMAGSSDRTSKRPASSPLKRRGPVSKPAPRGIDLQFNAHADLHVGAAMFGTMRSTHDNNEPLHGDYATIMEGLEHELADIKTSSFEDAVQRLANMRAQYGGPADVSAHLSSDPISELSDLGDMDEEEEEEHEAASYYHSHHSTNAHRSVTGHLPSRPVSMYADPTAPAFHRTGGDRSYMPYPEEDGYSSAASTSRQLSTSSHAGTLRQQYTDGEASSSPPTSSGGGLADLDPFPPSPRKSKPRHTLSLAERTRMSMARRSMQLLQDEEPELPGNSNNRKAPPPPPPEEEEDDEEEEHDLVSRTRISMAGFERAQQKARTDRQREMRRELKRARALPPRREGSQWED